MTGTGARWVVLDVGETIIDESRIWAAWADALGIPRTTFMSVFGALVERGLNYPQLADYFPVDWAAHRDAVESDHRRLPCRGPVPGCPAGPGIIS